VVYVTRRLGQRFAAAGSGNGEPAGAASAGAAAGAAGFGFFGRCGFLTGFGGVAGWSSANTGLGSVVTEAGVVKSPGFLITFTGTLAGACLGSAKATVKGASGAGTETEQGVLQPGPSEVLASAPGGLDSSRTWTVGGADWNTFHEGIEEQPPRLIAPRRLAPANAIAMTRRMTIHFYCDEPPHPHADLRIVVWAKQPAGHA
jgi:hypothetical protein